MAIATLKAEMYKIVEGMIDELKKENDQFYIIT